jgi:ABC-type amino acid transport substrate-binding protein
MDQDSDPPPGGILCASPEEKIVKRITLATLAVLSPLIAWSADCPVKAPAELVTSGKLTIATHLTTPPQAFLDNNKPAGMAVDLGEALAKKMCLQAEFVDVPFAGLFPGINAHKFDTVIAGVGITPARQESFDFVPYFQGGVRLLNRKDSPKTFNNENELCGSKVATQTGSTEAIGLERANKETYPEGKKIEILSYPNFNEAVEQLRKKVAEVAFVDWPFANYLAQAVPELKLASPILSGTPGAPRNKHGMMVRKGDKAMSTALEQALKQVQDDGSYDKILAKWNLSEGDIRQVK